MDSPVDFGGLQSLGGSGKEVRMHSVVGSESVKAIRNLSLRGQQEIRKLRTSHETSAIKLPLRFSDPGRHRSGPWNCTICRILSLFFVYVPAEIDQFHPKDIQILHCSCVRVELNSETMLCDIVSANLTSRWSPEPERKIVSRSCRLVSPWLLLAQKRT